MPRKDQDAPLDPKRKICGFSMIGGNTQWCMKTDCEFYIDKAETCCFRVLNQISYSLREIMKKVLGQGRE